MKSAFYDCGGHVYLDGKYCGIMTFMEFLDFCCYEKADPDGRMPKSALPF